MSEQEIDPGRVAELLEGGEAQIVDVREQYEHDAGRIPGTRHVELVDLPAAADSLDRERPVVFYCRSGERSAMAANAFRASGWDAYTMTGGLIAWADAGRPLDPPDGTVAGRRPGPQT